VRAAIVVLGVSLFGCADQERPRDFEGGTPALAMLTRDLRQALARHAPVRACGPDRAFTSDRALLVLSARDCMSCRSAGYLLRQLGLRTAFDVLTDGQDAREVCDFLQREKAEGAVFRFNDARFRNVALANRFLLFRRVGNGGIAGAVFDADVGRLLAQWDSLLQAHPAP
jgi:hypothetical protein